jgi:hypothetical protein
MAKRRTQRLRRRRTMKGGVQQPLSERMGHVLLEDMPLVHISPHNGRVKPVKVFEESIVPNTTNNNENQVSVIPVYSQNRREFKKWIPVNELQINSNVATEPHLTRSNVQLALTSRLNMPHNTLPTHIANYLNYRRPRGRRTTRRPAVNYNENGNINVIYNIPREIVNAHIAEQIAAHPTVDPDRIRANVERAVLLGMNMPTRFGNNNAHMPGPGAQEPEFNVNQI